MDVATITIEQEKAQEYYEAYSESVREARHEERITEDEMMRLAFKAAAKGQELLHLSDSMRLTGVDDRGLPRLAISRASADWTYLMMRHDGSAEFSEQPSPPQRANLMTRRLPPGTFPRRNQTIAYWDNWRAMVPTIPPQLRPKWKLGNYHILWEAEWVKHQVRAPRDPYLLRHLGGELYAVLAAWDLTEVERAVLAHREA